MNQNQTIIDEQNKELLEHYHNQTPEGKAGILELIKALIDCPIDSVDVFIPYWQAKQAGEASYICPECNAVVPVESGLCHCKEVSQDA